MNKIKNCLHSVYKFIGYIFCIGCLVYWKLRDKLFPPKTKYILFVAHPDDDTLFFHTYIKQYKPYVVLCTTGWSLRRLPCFFKAMKYYGVRFRAYPLRTRDKSVKLLEKCIKESLAIGHFEMCVTHNAAGEYGHEMHRRVHDIVITNTEIPIMVPIGEEYINEYPLDEHNIYEKKFLFENIYVTETWVLKQYSKWVLNEKLIKI